MEEVRERRLRFEVSGSGIMKLKNDFGIRAWLATLSGMAYYGLLFLVFIKMADKLTFETVVALLGSAGAPFLMAMTAYFAQRTNQPPNNGGSSK